MKMNKRVILAISTEHPQYTISKEGVYLFVMKILPKSNVVNPKFAAKVSIEMKSDAGYLSVVDWPLLPVNILSHHALCFDSTKMCLKCCSFTVLWYHVWHIHCDGHSVAFHMFIQMARYSTNSNLDRCCSIPRNAGKGEQLYIELVAVINELFLTSIVWNTGCISCWVWEFEQNGRADTGGRICSRVVFLCQAQSGPNSCTDCLHGIWNCQVIWTKINYLIEKKVSYGPKKACII